MDEKKKKKRRHVGAASAVAAVTSASMVLGGAFASPDELMNPEDGAPVITDTITPDGGDGGSDGDFSDELQDEDEDKLRGGLRSRVRQWVWRQPAAVRALVGVPLWLVGWVLIGALSTLWGGLLSPVLGQVLTWLLTAAALIGAFALTAKLMFPDTPVKKLVNRRSVFGILLGVTILAAVSAVLPLFWDGYGKFETALRGLGSAGILGTVTALFGRREHKKRKAEAEKKAAQEIQKPKETMAQARRRVLEMVDAVSSR